ncbi:MAG: hypothetical protein QGI83_21335 [Candidatus Latescibacteria bacterium]|jgi:hypothetical protein|nr:hypothetical protein [Candidatus Latescibacterota bacterium]
MDAIVKILMILAGVFLIIAGLYALPVISAALWSVSGSGFLYGSIGCSMYAIGLHVIKPFGGGGSGE